MKALRPQLWSTHHFESSLELQYNINSTTSAQLAQMKTNIKYPVFLECETWRNAEPAMRWRCYYDNHDDADDDNNNNNNNNNNNCNNKKQQQTKTCKLYRCLKLELPSFGPCTLCFFSPTKMLYFNALFFPLKCLVSTKMSLKCSIMLIRDSIFLKINCNCLK